MQLVRVDRGGPHLDEVRTLLGEYWQAFGFTPCFQGFDEEVKGLPGAYGPPRGALLLEDGALHLLDQRRLPAQVEIVRTRTARETAQAIRDMVVRGAPAIGCAAAYGLALALRSGEDFAEARSALLDSRPTAVNLRWAVERLSSVQPRAFEALRAEADRVLAEDLAACRAIGRYGAALVPDAVGIL